MQVQFKILTIYDVFAHGPAIPRVRAVAEGHFLDGCLVEVPRRAYDIKRYLWVLWSTSYLIPGEKQSGNVIDLVSNKTMRRGNWGFKGRYRETLLASLTSFTLWSSGGSSNHGFLRFSTPPSDGAFLA